MNLTMSGFLIRAIIVVVSPYFTPKLARLYVVLGFYMKL